MELNARRPRISESSNKYISLSETEQKKYFTKLSNMYDDENYQSSSHE